MMHHRYLAQWVEIFPPLNLYNCKSSSIIEILTIARKDHDKYHIIGNNHDCKHTEYPHESNT